MSKRIAILIIFLSNHLFSFSQSIQGVVRDRETNEPLPFAHIKLLETSVSTLTNKNGEFVVNTRANHTQLMVSYIGYRSETFALTDTNEFHNLYLAPETLTLNEIVVRPITPQQLIKRAVKKIPQNYTATSYATMSYYRSKFTENGQFITMDEGIFYSNFPSEKDTVKNQHQLLLYKTADIREVQFMREKTLKKEARKKKKAEKNGDEYVSKDKEAISVGFGGPESSLESHLTKKLEPCIDSTEFKEFEYRWGNNTFYQGRELITIHFETKNKVDHLKHSGKIYIDVDTEAFVNIEYEGKFIIPVAIEPLLLAFGLVISNPHITKKIRYQYKDGSWYPETFQEFVQLEIKKIHLFSKNEKADMEIEQVFNASEIFTKDFSIIDKSHRFDTSKGFKDQVYNTKNVNWDQFQTVFIEEVLSTAGGL